MASDRRAAMNETAMEKLTEYYTCFYEKHLELYEEAFPRVDLFIDSVVSAVEAEGGAAPPTQACLQWMCAPSLQFSLLTQVMMMMMMMMMMTMMMIMMMTPDS